MALVSAEKLNRMIEMVKVKCDALDEETRKGLDKTLDITFEEHFTFQNMQAEAHVTEVLSTDAALIVYNALGEVGSDSNGGWAEGTNLATKIVVTQLMGELLDRKLKQRRAQVI